MKKKSISKKLNIFRTSPLISVICILEVIVLVCVSTYAWFVFAENNKAHTDIISVEPDSGLEIDFNEANEDDYINIWNYLEEFTFEPVTSLDGRNIFVPTTGTFNSTNTSEMKFREATVNDMNSKYINIDFSLTNTGEEDMDVYLNSRSYFKFNDSANGKALRLAFYQNDGSSGRVASSLLSEQYDGDTPETPENPEGSGDSESTYLVYFDITGSDWKEVWINADWTNTGTNQRFQMTQLKPGSSIYYIDLYDTLHDHGSTSFTFMKFYNTSGQGNGNNWLTVQLPAGQIESNTVYSFDLRNGKAYEGSLNGHNGLMLADPKLYVGSVPDVGGDDEGDGGTNDTPEEPETEGQTTVYFNNTLGWEHPYAYIWQDVPNGTDEYLAQWPGKPMTHLSGNIYYYTFNSKYDYIIFNDGNAQGGAVKTKDIKVQDGYIYTIAGTDDNGYDWSEEDYDGSVSGGTYPVISPGVSAGFERPYAPVTEIDNSSGNSMVVVPAFAKSIDDYNYGSRKLFSIKKGQTLNLSMIVWLEGTDPDCTEDVYSGKYIDMNLVFATSGTGGEDMYTYKFLDKTKENWIDDKLTTDTGVTYKPVMQLYDAENHKGYLMKLLPDGITWTVDAPQELRNSQHIIFRRVNPMNEEEVWNYWETKGFGSLTDLTTDNVIVPGGEGENATVYFTAFSDGAPTHAKKGENAKEEPNAPAYSCGGLWGNHDTQLVTVYDGTVDHWIKNSDIKDTTSVLTINYTYNEQTVEYKASGPDKDFYYFIVPTRVYSNQNPSRPSITFKRYYNFNTKYALNSVEFNPDITYHRMWGGNTTTPGASVGVCNGKYFSISETTNGTEHCYWGYDALYVQAKEIVKSQMDNAFMQVHFYAASGGSDRYAYLYKNNNFKPDDNGYGYVAIIPSDGDYVNYRVERCDPNNHSTQWDVSPKYEIVKYNSNNVTFANCVADNICSIESFGLKIYLEATTSLAWQNNDPHCYMWDADGGHGNNGWPGPEMHWETDTAEGGGTGYKQYSIIVDNSRYDHIIFSSDAGQTNDIQIGTGSDCTVSGKIYQWTGDRNGRWRGTTKSGVAENERLNTVLYNSPDWP